MNTNWQKLTGLQVESESSVILTVVSLRTLLVRPPWEVVPHPKIKDNQAEVLSLIYL